MRRGTSFGAPTELEIELAELIIAAVPSVAMVRMVNSGTEATMSAIRLARGFTGRGYHHQIRRLLPMVMPTPCWWKPGPGSATLNIPGSPGVPDAFVRYTISLPYNDIECVRKVMAERGEDIAAIIVEPVAGNMGLVKPVDGFLETLRTLTEQYGSLLIFDEGDDRFRGWPTAAHRPCTASVPI